MKTFIFSLLILGFLTQAKGQVVAQSVNNSYQVSGINSYARIDSRGKIMPANVAWIPATDVEAMERINTAAFLNRYLQNTAASSIAGFGFYNTGTMYVGAFGYGNSGSGYGGFFVDVKSNSGTFSITSGTGVRILLTGTGNITASGTTTTARLKVTSIPTGTAGLSSGDVWSNGGVLNIIP